MAFRVARDLWEPVVLGGEGFVNNPSTLQVGDLDTDGLMDIAVSGLDPHLYFFLQKAPRDFRREPDEVLTVTSNNEDTNLVLADLDGRGGLDIVAVDTGAQGLAVFFQARPGVYPTSPSVVLGGPTSTPAVRSVAAAHIDGDGEIDLIAGNRESVSIFWGGR